MKLVKKTLYTCAVLATFVGACGEPLDGDFESYSDEELDELDVDGTSQELFGGQTVPSGSRPAIVSLGNVNSPFCTGTLINSRTILTAAHCFGSCGSVPNLNAVTVNFDGGVSRTGRWMSVHPLNCVSGTWLANDYAVIALNSAAPTSATPLQIAPQLPSVGQTHTLVGFGGNSAGCTPNVTGTKRSAVVTLSQVVARTPAPAAGTALTYSSTQRYACPGDSGGPALNSQNQIVGVSGWGNSADNSNYAAATVAAAWLGVTVYDATNYGGSAQVFVAGSYSHTAMTGVPNDAISSMRIAPGYSVRLWAESGAWGDNATYSGSVANVGALLNNRASHIEVLPGVTMYTESNFWGGKQTFVAGNYNVAAIAGVGNDQVSSLVVSPGMQVLACSESGWWGDCVTFVDSVAYVGDLLNDRISSIRVFAR